MSGAPVGPRLVWEVIPDCEGWDDAVGDAQATADRALAGAVDHVQKREGPRAFDRAVLSVLLTDDQAMHRLNLEFRGVDKPTNVLAFPAAQNPVGPASPEGGDDQAEGQAEAQADDAGEASLGDLALGLETLLREAAAQGKTPSHHMAHLLVHGLLHLLGYDHVDDADAARMEALETAILADLGIPDPYLSHESARDDAGHEGVSGRQEMRSE